MALGNTPRRETNFYVEANKSYAFAVALKTKDGKPVDIMGHMMWLTIAAPRHLGGFEVIRLLGLNMDDQFYANGTAEFRLQARDLELEPAEYPYDITLFVYGGYSVPLLKGVFEVGPNTDTDTSNEYWSTGGKTAVEAYGVHDTVAVIIGNPEVVKVGVGPYPNEYAPPNPEIAVKGVSS